MMRHSLPAWIIRLMAHFSISRTDGLPLMIIDSHQHFWRYKPTRDVWITEEMAVLQHDFLPDDFEPELDRNGVAATIAVQASQSDEETRFLLDLAASNDRIC